MTRFSTLFAALVIGLGTAHAADAPQPAKAQKKDFACLASLSGSPQLMFDNTGFKHSDGPVAEFYGECTMFDAFYVGGYRAQSLVASARGNEWDAILGRRGSVGPVDYDVRVHYYRFNVGDGVELEQVGGRLALSHDFKLGGRWTLVPMALIDVSPIITTNQNIVGGAVGLAAKRKFVELWGAPTFELNAKVWHYFETPAPNKGTPITSITAKLDYGIRGTSCTAGPTGLVTFGDIIGPDPLDVGRRLDGVA